MTKKAENPAPHPSTKPPPPPAPPPRKLSSWPPPLPRLMEPEPITRPSTNEDEICRKLANYLASKPYSELNTDEISLLGDLEQAGWIAVIRSERE